MFAALLACLLFFTPSDADFAYTKASELVSKYTPRDSGTFRGRFAALFIYDSLIQMGANPILDKFTAQTPKGTRLFSNVYAEWEGASDADWVVLLSHFDTKPGKNCPGANDGASTTGILLAISQILINNPPKNINIALEWLDGEECILAYTHNDGFWGSKHAAKKLRDSGRRVKAVICLDMLGDENLNIILPRNSSYDLKKIALQAALNTGYANIVNETSELIKDDHVAFLKEGFPAIDLIDFDYGNNGCNNYWHTPQDTMDKISKASLIKSGSVVVEMINILSRQ